MLIRKISLKLFFIAYWVIFLSSISSAELYRQKQGLFTINIPNGWHVVSDSSSGVEFKSSKQLDGISIAMTPLESKSKEDFKKLVAEDVKALQQCPYPFKMEGLKEIRIDGVTGYQSSYQIRLNGTLFYNSDIYLFSRGHIISVSFGYDSKTGRAKHEKIVKTMRF